MPRVSAIWPKERKWNFKYRLQAMAGRKPSASLGQGGLSSRVKAGETRGEWTEEAMGRGVEVDTETEEDIEEVEESVTEVVPVGPVTTVGVTINAWAATRRSMVEVATDVHVFVVAHLYENMSKCMLVKCHPTEKKDHTVSDVKVVCNGEGF